MGRVKSELAWDGIERKAAEEAGEQICLVCDRAIASTDGGICDDCWWGRLNSLFGSQ